MNTSRKRLNELLTSNGYRARGDLILARSTWNKTEEVDNVRTAAVVNMSTDIGQWFAPGGLRLERFRKNPIVLWSHDNDGHPVASSLWDRVRVEEGGVELTVKPQFHFDTELSREVWALVKDGVRVEWEIGVLPIEWKFSTGTQVLVTRWCLMEVSAVPGGACVLTIRERIKERKISSPAIIRSVEVLKSTSTPDADEPNGEFGEFDEDVGPYSWRCLGTALPEPWAVIGPGFDARANTKADAEARANELNTAWSLGRDYAAGDAPPPDHIENRVTALEEWQRAMRDRFERASTLLRGEEADYDE